MPHVLRFWPLLTLTSIRELKALASREDAELWPNHAMACHRSCHPFPRPYQ